MYPWNKLLISQCIDKLTLLLHPFNGQNICQNDFTLQPHESVCYEKTAPFLLLNANWTQKKQKTNRQYKIILSNSSKTRVAYNEEIILMVGKATQVVYNWRYLKEDKAFIIRTIHDQTFKKNLTGLPLLPTCFFCRDEFNSDWTINQVVHDDLNAFW